MAAASGAWLIVDGTPVALEVASTGKARLSGLIGRDDFHGALLLTPGFFTDAFGFACLLPAGRAWLVRLAMRRLAAADC